MGFIQIFTLVIQAITALPKLIEAAESVFGALKGHGAAKKQLVTDALSAGLAVAVSAGAGIKPEIQAQIINGAAGLVDGIVASKNAVSAWGQEPGGPDR
jgi:hypothetical protein